MEKYGNFKFNIEGSSHFRTSVKLFIIANELILLGS